MESAEFDLCVIGAGIQGAGVAQAAAAAGHSVLLLERGKIAGETSSRSSKLIHGGLRYLETLQLRLVRESLRERGILLRIAPHLVRLETFFIPVRRAARRGPWTLRAGLGLYGLLAGGRGGFFGTVPRREWQDLDGLRTQDLEAVFTYQDGATDDALLTRAVIASARELSAKVRTFAEVLGGSLDGTTWRVRFRAGTGEHEVRAHCIVNAAGPYASEVAARFEPAGPCPALELVAGTHLELPGSLARGAYFVESARDGRGIFVLPWRGRTLLGTTELPWQRSPAEVAPTPGEIQYLLEVFRGEFPTRPSEVLRAWSGLRVLQAGQGSAFSRPREVLLAVDQSARGFLSVVGGKLTGYRATAERVLARLRRDLPLRVRRADTRTLRLPEPPPAGGEAVTGPPGDLGT